jgi:hypothetical protein
LAIAQTFYRLFENVERITVESPSNAATRAFVSLLANRGQLGTLHWLVISFVTCVLAIRATAHVAGRIAVPAKGQP